MYKNEMMQFLQWVVIIPFQAYGKGRAVVGGVELFRRMGQESVKWPGPNLPICLALNMRPTRFRRTCLLVAGHLNVVP